MFHSKPHKEAYYTFYLKPHIKALLYVSPHVCIAVCGYRIACERGCPRGLEEDIGFPKTGATVVVSHQNSIENGTMGHLQEQCALLTTGPEDMAFKMNPELLGERFIAEGSAKTMSLKEAHQLVSSWERKKVPGRFSTPCRLGIR